MVCRTKHVRQKLANPFYDTDYVERLEKSNSVDLQDNFLRLQINSKYSKIINISEEKKINKGAKNFFQTNDEDNNGY